MEARACEGERKEKERERNYNLVVGYATTLSVPLLKMR
jgi:hypothetical protein